MDKIDRKRLGIILICSAIIISILLVYRIGIVIINSYSTSFDALIISISLMIIFTLNLISKLGFYFLNTKDK